MWFSNRRLKKKLWSRLPKPKSKPKKQPPPKRHKSEEAIRGERVYQFTVDGLEALTGTSRQLAVNQSDNVPRQIKVKVPAGVHDCATIKIKFKDYPTGETRPIRIKIKTTMELFVKKHP